MIFPDYKNSVVNVSSSVIKAFGGRVFYSPLKELAFLKKSEKIVLLVIDGLGYEFLKERGQNTFLWENCIGKITSVFPTTTASAETSLETGVAPQQHGITGWTMYLKELGIVSKILLFEARFGGSLLAAGINRDDIYTESILTEKIYAPSVMVLPRIVAARFCTDDWAAPFNDLDGMIGQIEKALIKPEIRFVYSYWIELDYICHKYGCASKEAKNHLFSVDNAIKNLAGLLKKEKASLVIVADHGLCDIPKNNRIVLQDYCDIYDCLILPLCGDSRAPFCYVKMGRGKEFENLVKKKLGFCCVLRKSSDLLKNGVFGSGKPNVRLADRIGDYVLLAKEGYTIRDLLMKEAKPVLKAHHGGLSKEEMYVPLIVIR
jgi:hypothetical protein